VNGPCTTPDGHHDSRVRGGQAHALAALTFPLSPYLIPYFFIVAAHPVPKVVRQAKAIQETRLESFMVVFLGVLLGPWR
jgi:hypothetical protein